MQITENFIFGDWQGARWMKKWKNEKQSSLPKLITKRTMFLKTQNFPAFEILRISTARTNKKMKAK